MNPRIRSGDRAEDSPPTHRRLALASLGTAALLALLVCAAVAQAGPLEDAVERIEDKVDDLDGKVGTVLSNTNGVQGLVSNVQGVTSGFGSGVIDDLRNRLSEAQDLLQFFKDREDGAGSSSDHPDIAALVTSLETILSLLLDDPDVDFGVLSGLLQVVPDKVLAVAGKAVGAAGVDGTFVTRLQDAAADLALLIDVLRQDDAEQRLTGSTQAVEPIGVPMLQDGTECAALNAIRREAKIAAGAVLAFGIDLTIAGGILEGSATTVQTDKEVGIHGYTALAIKTDIPGAMGKILAAGGRGVIAIAGSAFLRLRHCELIWYHQRNLERQAAIVDNQTALFADQAAILANQKVILRRLRRLLNDD